MARSETELYKLELVDLVGKREDKVLKDDEALRSALGRLEEVIERVGELMP